MFLICKIELHNTCVVDTQFLEIEVDPQVDSANGDVYLRVPGLYQSSAGNYYFYYYYYYH